jgi:hypothetical protein
LSPSNNYSILQTIVSHQLPRLRILKLGWLGVRWRGDSSSQEHFSSLPKTIEDLTCTPFNSISGLNAAVEQRLTNLKKLRILDGSMCMQASRPSAVSNRLRFRSLSLESLHLDRAGKGLYLHPEIDCPNLSYLSVKDYAYYGCGARRLPLARGCDWQSATGGDMGTFAATDVKCHGDSSVRMPGIPSKCEVRNRPDE